MFLAFEISTMTAARLAESSGQVQIQNLDKYCCDWVDATAKQRSRMRVSNKLILYNTEFLSLPCNFPS